MDEVDKLIAAGSAAGGLRPAQRGQRGLTGGRHGPAVHFGAGNIGRGFVGLILHRAGYEVVFADVADALIDALQVTPSYLVQAVGLESSDETVDNYRAINSRSHEAERGRGDRRGGHRHHRGRSDGAEVRGAGHRRGAAGPRRPTCPRWR